MWMVRCLVLLCVSSACFGSIFTKVTPQKLELGQMVSVVFEIQGNLESEFELPEIDDVDIVNQESMQGMTMGFGQGMSVTRTITYHLRPNRTGSFAIPSFEVSIDGETHQIGNLRFEVVKGQPKTRTGNEPVFLEREISSRKVYVGQPLVDTLKFYSLPGVLKGGNISEYQLKDAMTVKLDKESAFKENVKGRTYDVIPVQYVIVPGRSGSLELVPHQAEVSLNSQRKPSRRGWDPFDDFFGRVERKQLWSTSESVEVLPLPQPQPSDFSGLVGNFNVSAEISHSKLKVGETATLTLKIEGDGELGPLGNYSLSDVPGLKFYADQPEEQEVYTSFGVQSKKIMKFAVVPVEAGLFSIIPDSIGVFKPSRHGYEELKFSAVSVEVSGGKSSRSKPYSGISSQPKSTDIESDNNFLPLDDIVRGKDIYRNHGITKKEIQLWSLVAVSPWLARGGYWIVLATQRRRSKNSRRRNALKNIKKLKKTNSATDVMSEWNEYLAAIQGLNNDALTQSDIVPTFSEEYRTEISNVYQQLELRLYGRSGESSDLSDILTSMSGIIKKLEKSL